MVPKWLRNGAKPTQKSAKMVPGRHKSAKEGHIKGPQGLLWNPRRFQEGPENLRPPSWTPRGPFMDHPGTHVGIHLTLQELIFGPIWAPQRAPYDLQTSLRWSPRRPKRDRDAENIGLAFPQLLGHNDAKMAPMNASGRVAIGQHNLKRDRKRLGGDRKWLGGSISPNTILKGTTSGSKRASRVAPNRLQRGTPNKLGSGAPAGSPLTLPGPSNLLPAALLC